MICTSAQRRPNRRGLRASALLVEPGAGGARAPASDIRPHLAGGDFSTTHTRATYTYTPRSPFPFSLCLYRAGGDRTAGQRGWLPAPARLCRVGAGRPRGAVAARAAVAMGAAHGGAGAGAGECLRRWGGSLPLAGQPAGAPRAATHLRPPPRPGCSNAGHALR
jgi:hypothetical protein